MSTSRKKSTKKSTSTGTRGRRGPRPLAAVGNDPLPTDVAVDEPIAATDPGDEDLPLDETGDDAVQHEQLDAHTTSTGEEIAPARDDQPEHDPATRVRGAGPSAALPGFEAPVAEIDGRKAKSQAELELHGAITRKVKELSTTWALAKVTDDADCRNMNLQHGRVLVKGIDALFGELLDLVVDD